MIPLELDVTLTDYGLAVECGVLAWLLARLGAAGSAQRFWFTSTFLTPRYFDHNALYHSIQALALFFVWLGAREVLGSPRPEGRMDAGAA